MRVGVLYSESICIMDGQLTIHDGIPYGTDRRRERCVWGGLRTEMFIMSQMCALHCCVYVTEVGHAKAARTT